MADDSLRHALSDKDLEDCFRERIVPQVLCLGRPTERPGVLLLAGQTGAGKTRTREALAAALRRGGAVTIGSDLLRGYHPVYARLLRRDPDQACFYTDHDARRWVDRALEYAVQARLSVVFDSTLSRPDTARRVADRFRRAGYHQRIAIIAAPAALSRLGVLERYVRSAFGRFSLNHDETYSGVIAVAEAIDRSTWVGSVGVYRRGGVSLYENHLDGNGGWAYRPAAAQVISSERQRPWTAEEAADFLRDVQVVAGLFDRRRPAVRGVWYERIAEAAELAAPLIADAEQRQRLRTVVHAMREQARTRSDAASQVRSGPDASPRDAGQG